MKILIVSDAWLPQVNGVVRTLESTASELKRMGHDVLIVGPDTSRWCAFCLPFYTEIKVELFAASRLKNILRSFQPDFIHLATEGPLGWSARRLCLRHGRPFTTSYHTRFPEYFAARVPWGTSRIVLKLIYDLLRRFHAPSGAVMVATASIEETIRKRKFHRIVRWSRGVDTDMYSPSNNRYSPFDELPRPILLYVGRVAIEKNLPAFLDLKTPGSKVVIGDGPDLPGLRRHYPDARFLGVQIGNDLARAYAAADLFVFPSLTDTFGLVLIEACASGLRLAACPAPGPIDLFACEAAQSFAVLDQNLQKAVDRALALPHNPEIPRRFAEDFSWRACTEQFYQHLQAPSPVAK
ncbi:MAG: glycosyltransferase family 1 protein [Alphaproteobacteria bacterium]|nr:glycosyltransferase family 1 protein [Alphaproteobacteria bacterium]